MQKNHNHNHNQSSGTNSREPTRSSQIPSTTERSSGGVFQSSRSRQTKGEPRRRSHDVAQNIETAIHVLDNGVDRTPAPLQKRASRTGVPRDSRLAGAPGSSISALLPLESSSMFHSSILNSSMDQGVLTSTASHGSPSQVGFMTASSSLTSVSVDRRVSTPSTGSSFGGLQTTAPVGGTQMMREEYAVMERPRVFTREERRMWLEEKTTIVLTETPTIMLYMHQDEVVPNDRKEELQEVQRKNAAYAELVEAKRVDEGTRFQEKGVWTFVPPKKSIHCSIQPPHKKNAGGLQVTPWMLKDQFAALNMDVMEALEQDNDEDEEDGELVEEASDHEKDAVSESTAEQSSRGNVRATSSWMFSDSLLSTLRIMERAVVQNTMEEVQLSYRGITMDPAARRVPRPIESEEVKNPTEETDSGVAIGTTTPTTTVNGPNIGGVDVGQDTHAALTAGVGITTTSNVTPTVIVKADVPSIKMSDDIKALWTFRSPLTKNRSTTCMAWNCKESDILAVGYSSPYGEESTEGNDTTAAAPGGIVCCWSLKNPLAPERIIRLPVEAGVSSVAFSYEYPSLLAVGNTEGGIVIYDIQKDTNIPAIRTTVTSGQHTGAVWELKWVARGKERGEFLMSISGDGRVVQWAVGKTIERIAPDLMTLKRQHGTSYESAFADDGNNHMKRNDGQQTQQQQSQQQQQQPQQQQQQRRKHDALFSRQCGGMCLDVSPADGTIYVVGTEDGHIHQCNKSQTENYELDYTPHSELVYRVRWSPFSDSYFLTCSADWSSRLYRLGQSSQLLTFDSPNQNAVQDVAWSFTNSTTFATVTAQGNIELWSITDVIQPRSRAQFKDQRRLTCVLFAEQEAPVIVVGDERGDVTVLRLLAPCYGSMNMTGDEQERELEEAIRKATS